MSNRRAVVGVMGAGEGASAEAVALAEELGECISARGWVLLTGGRPAGVMAAASRGAARVDGHLVVGVLPDEGKGDERQSTAELDLALFPTLSISCLVSFQVAWFRLPLTGD